MNESTISAIEGVIENELKRSSPAHTRKVVLDTFQALLNSEDFHNLPTHEKSNIFFELRSLADFKTNLSDNFTQGRGPD